MQHTTNYNLNQWEDGDVVRREDFNADNAKIAAALKSASDAAANVPEIVFGTYTGNGAASQTIYLGKKPRAVLVEPANGSRADTYNTRTTTTYGGLAVQGGPVISAGCEAVAITGSGFRVASAEPSGEVHIRCNENAIGYHYIALI